MPSFQYSSIPLLRYSNAWSFLFVPLQNDAVHNAADLEQLVLVVHHFRTSEPGDGVILAQKDGLFGTDFFTHPAENAANHINIELARIFLDLAKAVVRWNFARLDFDRPRRAEGFAGLTGNATDAAGLVPHPSGRAAIVFRPVRSPFFSGVLP